MKKERDQNKNLISRVKKNFKTINDVNVKNWSLKEIKNDFKKADQDNIYNNKAIEKHKKEFIQNQTYSDTGKTKPYRKE